MATQNNRNKRMVLVCAGLAACNGLVAAAAQAQDLSFEEAQNFGTGDHPDSVAVGDFNGDGVQDLLLPVRDPRRVQPVRRRLHGGPEGSGLRSRKTRIRQGILPGQLNVHSDRGSSMKSKPVANDPDEAIAWLKTIPPPFVPPSLQSDPDFANLRHRPEFQAIFTRGGPAL